jgi:anti-sigma regulatory factor (Ser/Thr protein kinase)
LASRIFHIDESTRVAEVRRNATALARGESLDEEAVSDAAIIATELSTNLLKHAARGEIHLSPLSDREHAGVEILSIDRGPGIGNLRSCLADGFSSVGTAGTGLGAVVRLSTTFDAYSEVGRGTVLVSRLYAQPANTSAPPDGSLPKIFAGVVSRPVSNEPVSGDRWALKHTEGGALLLVADGLGHGPLAAEASGAAAAAFRQAPDTAPVAILRQIHAALKGTRGAAVAVAHLDYKQSQCHFAGIGNIAGRVIGRESASHMVSHVGTAGYEARRFQEFTYELPHSAAVVMHSDGLTSSWSLDHHAGLLSHDPALIAAVLYRDSTRARDDVCVMVAKRRNPE